jgi:hypothetical protein
VLLLHMCITTRASWEPVARELAASGVHTMTVDNRGFGESGGPRFESANPAIVQPLNEKWPADFDAALAWLESQPDVDKSRIGIGVGSIDAWFVDTLVTNPADPKASFTPKPSAVADFWAMVNEPGGTAKAARLLRETRARDPQALLFPESIMNALGYGRLTAGDPAGAVAAFALNIEAYPASANARDSLADAYAAGGQTALALAAEQKCLELLPADKNDAQFKERLRQMVEAKVAKLKTSK